MKFAIVKEQRDFFQKNGWIEFENFLTNHQINILNLSLDKVISQRTEIPLNQIQQINAEQCFLNGRDLWRVNEDLYKFICQPGLAQIASELIEKKPIRFGYDQLLINRKNPTSFFPENPKVYNQYLEKGTDLASISPVKEVLAGVLIGLSNPSDDLLPQASEGVDIFPKNAGNIIFISPHCPIDLTKIYNHNNQRFYLLVFTAQTAFYIPQLNDPLGHHLKQYGYIINDKLTDKLNPIIYR